MAPVKPLSSARRTFAVGAPPGGAAGASRMRLTE